MNPIKATSHKRKAEEKPEERAENWKVKIEKREQENAGPEAGSAELGTVIGGKVGVENGKGFRALEVGKERQALRQITVSPWHGGKG